MFRLVCGSTRDRLGLAHRICRACVALTTLSVFSTPVRSQEISARAAHPRNVPYVLERDSYQVELLAAQTDAQRRQVLENRWEAVKQAIQYCDIALDNAFQNSRRYWHSGYPSDPVIYPENLIKPLAEAVQAPAAGRINAGRYRLTIIHGDCLADVALAEGSTLHIYGDLAATVTAKSVSEVIVAGTVRPNGAMELNSSSRVFIGGDLAGKVTCKGSSTVWVNGNLTGEFGAGTARLRVVGNLSGAVQRVADKYNRLQIVVDGHTPCEVLAAIAQDGYTELRANIGASELPVGLHQISDPAVSSVNAPVFLIHRQARADGLPVANSAVSDPAAQASTSLEESLRRHAQAQIKRYDTSGDGALNQDELRAYARLPANADGDRDGAVALDELARALVGAFKRSVTIPGASTRANGAISLNATSVYFSGAEATDAGMRELSSLKQLRSLNVYRTQVTDAGLKELVHLPLLTQINLDGQLSEAGLRELARLKQLTSLGLSGFAVTDAGLKELAPLQQLKSLSFSGRGVTDAGLKELAHLKQLTGLSLSNMQLTDAGLKELASLSQLRNLFLVSTQVPEAGLKEVAHLAELTLLGLHDTPLTEAGLRELAHFKQLKSLSISGAGCTDAGLKEVAHLNQLTSLTLRGPGVTDAGLKEVAQLTELTNLSLSDAQLTNTGVKELVLLPKLTTLSLGGSGITENGLKELARLTQLTRLTLNDTPLTDAVLQEFASLQKLRNLSVYGSRVTDAGLNQLRAALPMCDIYPSRISRTAPSTSSSQTFNASPPPAAPGAGNTLEDRARRYAEYQIKRYDKNADGVLDAEEAKGSRLATGADKDGDGKITVDELVRTVLRK